MSTHFKQENSYGCGLYAIANIFQDESFITETRLTESQNGNHTGQLNKWLLEYGKELYLEPFYFNNLGDKLPEWVYKMIPTGEDVFSIPGRGTVATGRVERGVITKGAEVEIAGFGQTLKTTLTGIEMFHKELDRGEAGDNTGLLLRGLKRDQIRRGQVIVTPGTCKTHSKFLVKMYILNKDEAYVMGALTSAVGKDDDFRADISSVIATRLVNYSLVMAEKGSVAAPIIDRLAKLTTDCEAFTNDLRYYMIKEIVNGNKVKFAKLMQNTNVVKMAIS
jgi:hypothetical protein